MSLIPTLLMAFAAGVMAWLFYPFARSLVNEDAGVKLARGRTRLALSMIGRTILRISEHGDGALRRSQYNATLPAETVNTEAYQDKHGWMSRLGGKPFGIALQGPGVITVPPVADVAREIIDLKHSNEFYRHDSDSGQTFRKLFAAIPRGDRVVDPRWTRAIVRGGGSATTPETIREFIRRSQTPFYEQEKFKYMVWLTAMALGAGLVFFAGQVGGSVDTSALSEMGGVLP